MSMVRFATICDHCKKRSHMYQRFNVCWDCMDDVCPECSEPGTEIQEKASVTCKRCAALAKADGGQQ